MAQSQSNSAPVESESSDLLSNLPEDLRQKILECLPLQDAVRTSTLSTHWRHEWAKLTCIILDPLFFRTVCKGMEESQLLTTSSNIINSVLVNHVGPVRTFTLYNFRGLNDGLHINQCLEFISRKSITNLRLSGFVNELPIMVFSYTKLRSLTLGKFIISILPKTFLGFPCLTSLTLRGCNWKTVNLLENFIRRCPELRFRRLDCSNPITQLTIHAPKLENFCVGVRYEKLCLDKETTNITTLDLCYSFGPHWRLVFRSLPVLQCLRIGFFSFLEPSDHMHLGNQRVIDDLRRLETRTLELITAEFQCPFINYFVVKLLNSSPLLQRLYCRVPHFSVCSCEITPHISRCSQWDVKKADLSSLKYVEVVGVWRLKNVLSFIKFILECAPVLELMSITLNCEKMEGDDEMNIASELKECSRASKNVRIFLKGVMVREIEQ